LGKLATNVRKRRAEEHCMLQAGCRIKIVSKSGVDQMWILKNSKELLENSKSHGFSKITIPHKKLKSRLFQIIDNCFFKQKWQPEIQMFSNWKTRCIFCETLF
jgi:hypothetical protein